MVATPLVLQNKFFTINSEELFKVTIKNDIENIRKLQAVAVNAASLICILSPSLKAFFFIYTINIVSQTFTITVTLQRHQLLSSLPRLSSINENLVDFMHLS